MKTLFYNLFFLLLCLPSLIFPQKITELNLSLKEKKLPFGLTKLVPVDKPEVSLVLSGGGSRAISHIGVLEAIEEFKAVQQTSLEMLDHLFYSLQQRAFNGELQSAPVVP